MMTSSSNRGYFSLGASKFDTLSSKSVRPSTSFMSVSRKVAQQKHSQVPKNLFNPLTDQMTAIVGHKEEIIRNQLAASGDQPKNQSQRQNVLVKEL